jgi:hypothetical protein
MFQKFRRYCRAHSLRCKATPEELSWALTERWKEKSALSEKEGNILEWVVWKKMDDGSVVLPWDCVPLEPKQAREHRRKGEGEAAYPKDTVEKIQKVLRKVELKLSVV